VFVGLQQERRALLDRTTDLERRLEAVSGAKLDQSLERIERLLVMAGDEAAASGPVTEALEAMRRLRQDILAPVTPPQQR
jgi:hypothetical protein